MSWDRELPADPSVIQQLVADCGLALPKEYLDFLAYSNGGNGPLGVQPGWFSLWSAEDVMELNRGYGVDQWLPGFFGFGSNGGGELLAFDTRPPQPWKVYMVPFIGMDEEDAWLVADNFASFVEEMGREIEEEESPC